LSRSVKRSVVTQLKTTALALTTTTTSRRSNDYFSSGPALIFSERSLISDLMSSLVSWKLTNRTTPA